MSPQPTFSWSVSGGGTISPTGLFSATTPGGPFTVTAASGGVSGTASVTVTDFSLSASPTTRSIKHGQSTTYAVTITRKFGSNGSVAFTVTGLPANVTASFSPTSTTGTSSTLTVVDLGTVAEGDVQPHDRRDKRRPDAIDGGVADAPVGLLAGCDDRLATVHRNTAGGRWPAACR